MSYSEPLGKIRLYASRPYQPGADGGFSVCSGVGRESPWEIDLSRFFPFFPDNELIATKTRNLLV
jgi:hypothetical protein